MKNLFNCQAAKNCLKLMTNLFVFGPCFPCFNMWEAANIIILVKGDWIERPRYENAAAEDKVYQFHDLEMHVQEFC